MSDGRWEMERGKGEGIDGNGGWEGGRDKSWV